MPCRNNATVARRRGGSHSSFSRSMCQTTTRVPAPTRLDSQARTVGSRAPPYVISVQRDGPAARVIASHASRPLAWTPPGSSNAGNSPTYALSERTALGPGKCDGRRRPIRLAAPRGMAAGRHAERREYVRVHDVRGDRAGSDARSDLDHRSPRLQQRHARQEPRRKTGDVARLQPRSGGAIERGNDDPEQQKADDDAGRAEVHVKLHHLSDADTRAGAERQPGVLADQSHAAGDDGFLGPHDARY